MFTLQVGFMSPSFVGIVPSIEMVIFAAVGGRGSLVGAVYGTLLVNFGKTFFSERFPELWLFLIGALFILVGDGVPQRRRGDAPREAATTPGPGSGTAAARARGSEHREGVMTAKPIVLSVEGLTVSFDGFKAVDDLTFYVEKGEVRAVIGPNGAGKTTRARSHLGTHEGVVRARSSSTGRS